MVEECGLGSSMLVKKFYGQGILWGGRAITHPGLVLGEFVARLFDGGGFVGGVGWMGRLLIDVE